MTNLLEEFFNSKGIKKQITEFTPEQETEIQSLIDSIFKPAIEELIGDYNSYRSVTAQLSISKRYTDSIMENIIFKVSKTMHPKFFYRPKFLIEDGNIIIAGQFCIPNIYGECKDYISTDLNKLFKDLKKDDIKSDITAAFIKHSDI